MEIHGLIFVVSFIAIITMIGVFAGRMYAVKREKGLKTYIKMLEECLDDQRKEKS